MKLKGRVALITGAGAGLGREIALTFAREGVNVAVNDVRRDAAESVAAEVRGFDVEAKVVVADVSDSVEVRAIFEEITSVWGRLDILVNNAGIALMTDAVKANFLKAAGELLTSGRMETSVGAARLMADSQWRRTLSVHLDGTFYCTREALKVMEPRGSGKIINIASIAGLTGILGAPDYSAAKAGIIGLTKAVAREAIVSGVYVNAIAPGYVDTALLDFLEPAMKQMIVAQTPIGRLGTPEEVAAVALYLASDDSSYTVGQVISPNGGYFM